MLILDEKQLNKVKEKVYKNNKLLKVAQKFWLLGMVGVLVAGVLFKISLLVCLGILCCGLGLYLYPKAKEWASLELETTLHHLDNKTYLCEKYAEYTLKVKESLSSDSTHGSYNYYAYVTTDYGLLEVNLGQKTYKEIESKKAELYLIWYDTRNKANKGSIVDIRGKLQHPNMVFVNL